MLNASSNQFESLQVASSTVIQNNNENKLFCNFQIIPPKEFQFESLNVDTKTMINVQRQGIQTIPFKSKTLSRITKTKYANFLKAAMANDLKIKETTDEIEDRFWANLTNRGENAVQYSIHNPITLFPAEHRYWNISNFSEFDSLIHGVCILYDFII